MEDLGGFLEVLGRFLGGFGQVFGRLLGGILETFGRLPDLVIFATPPMRNLCF